MVFFVLTAVYFVAGKLALQLAIVNASASPVWPPTGIALAAFLVLGYHVWPSILLGAFLVNLTTAGGVATSVGIAVGNTLEGVVAAWLVSRFAGGRRAFDRAYDIFKFVFFAALLSTAVSATCGVTSLSLGGFADWAEYGSIWLTWWLGDAVGALIVAPVLLLWSANPRPQWNPAQVVEIAILLAGLVLVGLLVFGGRFSTEVRNYPLEFLFTPILIWAAFRFGPRETATGVAGLSGIAIWGTLHGFGPFVAESQNTSLLMLQSFMGVTSVMTLALAAEVSERTRAEERVHHLAISDPLTGLVNYRRLLEVMDSEIKRSERTRRSFAVLMLDLDGLKEINDAHGHLVGNEALCRLADVLRANCRATDTAGRYGGDEFVLILLEATGDGAERLARRIPEQVHGDGKYPPLAVSTGVAMYPQDGDSVDKLIGAADRSLYAMKRGRN